MYVPHVCIKCVIFMYHIYVLYLCIISMYHIYVSYLCIISMYQIYVSYLSILSMYQIHVSDLPVCIISMYVNNGNTDDKRTIKTTNMRLDALISFLIEWTQMELNLRSKQWKYWSNILTIKTKDAPRCTDHFSYWMETNGVNFKG